MVMAPKPETKEFMQAVWDKQALVKRNEGDQSVAPFVVNTIESVVEAFGGGDSFIDACKTSTVPAVMNFIRIYEHYKGEKSVSDCLVQADLGPAKLLEYIAPAMFMWNGPVAKLLHALNMPRTMKASIESAAVLGPKGAVDRKMQFEIAGFIKPPSGTNVFNTVNVGDMESFEDNIIDVTPNVQPQDNREEPEEGSD